MAGENIYEFNLNGECLSKSDRNHNITNFTYKDNHLHSVENNGGKLFFEYSGLGKLIRVWDHTQRSITYLYNQEGILEYVQNPLGESYQYKYDEAGRLNEAINPLGIKTVQNQFDEIGRTTKQTFPDGGTMEYRYDDSNQRVIMTEQNRNRIKYYKDDKFRNIKTVYKDGYERTEYNEKNQTTLFVDKNGNEFHYEYDPKGNLIAEKNPLGYKCEMKYNRSGKPQKFIRYDDSTIEYVYDNKEQMTKLIDPLGHATEYKYNGEGLINTILFPDQSEIKITYDERHNIAKITDSMGVETRFSYNECNKVSESVDGNGNQTKYAYDLCGNLVKVINAKGEERNFTYNANGKVIKVVDYDGSTITKDYNEINKISEITDTFGNKTKYEYDLMWNVKKEVGANGGETLYEYNQMNRLGKVTNAQGASVSYEYDPNGNLIKEIGTRGEAYTYKYNPLNLNVEIQEPNGGITQIEYDQMGRVVKATDALGNQNRTEYNAAGLKIKEISPLGTETTYEYNPLGLVTKVRNQRGVCTEYEYLPGGFLSKIIYPDKTTLSYGYDKNKNILWQEDQAGFRLDYTYDNLNRIIKISDKDTEKSYTYDAADNITSITDTNGTVTKYEYAPDGKLLKVLDAMGNIAEYEYDELRELKSVLQYGQLNANQKERHATLYKRNKLGQIESITDQLGHTEQYQYNKAGKLLRTVDRDGFHTSYEYTQTGETEKITYSDGKSVLFSYNLLRQVTEMEDWLGVTKIELDEEGRPKQITDHKGRTLSYGWTEGEEIESFTYPDGTTVEYEYDNAMRLKKLREKDKSITYSYNKDGRRESKEISNGVKTCYAYDEKGRLTGLQHERDGEVLDSYQYRYDKMGNKSKVYKTRKGLHQESGTYEYRYDKLNRLTTASKDGKVLREYGYDGYGNRDYFKEGSGEQILAYNEANQLVKVESDDGYTEYQYDNRGNVVRVWKDKILQNAYEYNARNKLGKAINHKGDMTLYQYNGMGFQIGKTLGKYNENSRLTKIYVRPGHTPYMGEINYVHQPAHETEYIMDMTKAYNNLLIKVEDGNPQRYLWDEEPAIFEDGEETGYYCMDDLGSPVRILLKSSQNGIKYEYDEYGKNTGGNTKEVQPFGYTGYINDPVSQLYFAQARYYNPNIGRFTGKDARSGILTEPLTLNYYLYCIGNPLMYIDPNGETPSFTAAGGTEAHKVLQSIVQSIYGKRVKLEMKIEGYPYSPTRTGTADIVLYTKEKVTNKDILEVYEIKPFSNFIEKPPLSPVGTRSTNGIQQREGYIKGLRSMKYKVNEKGNTFNPRGWTVPSALHPGYNIRYYTYPQEPGMIYYSYVKEPKEEPVAVPVPVPAKKKEEYSVLDGLAAAVMGILAGTVAAVLYADDVFLPGIGAADNGVATAAASLAITLLASAITGEKQDKEECVQ